MTGDGSSPGGSEGNRGEDDDDQAPLDEGDDLDPREAVAVEDLEHPREVARDLAEPDVTDHQKRPFHVVRALLLTMPLAILMGTVVAPPDPVVQLLLIGATLAGGLPITTRLVAGRRYGPVQLGIFFGVILVVTLVGLRALAAFGSGPLPDVLARFLVILVALGAGDLVVFRVLGAGTD